MAPAPCLPVFFLLPSLPIVHRRLSIDDCLKEIEETGYWIELLVDSGYIAAAQMAGLLDETRQLIAIYTTIDKRAKDGP